MASNNGKNIRFVSACREGAKELRIRLDSEGKGHLSIARLEITEMIRRKSYSDTTRIGSEIGREVDDALAVQGFGAFPRIADTTTGDWVRIYRLGGVFSYLLDLIQKPSPDGDAKLGGMITKIKRRSQSPRPRMSTGL